MLPVCPVVLPVCYLCVTCDICSNSDPNMPHPDLLTTLRPEQMADIFQIAFSNAFSQKKKFCFNLNFTEIYS